MTLDELKSSLASILAAEEQAQINWTTVNSLCDEVVRRLNCEPAPDYPFDVVYHFLDDPDVRRKDASYAQVQRERLKEWLV